MSFRIGRVTWASSIHSFVPSPSQIPGTKVLPALPLWVLGKIMGPKIFLGRAHGNVGMCGSVCMHSSVTIFRFVNMSGDKCAYVCPHISVYLYCHTLCIFHIHVYSFYTYTGSTSMYMCADLYTCMYMSKHIYVYQGIWIIVWDGCAHVCLQLSKVLLPLLLWL